MTNKGHADKSKYCQKHETSASKDMFGWTFRRKKIWISYSNIYKLYI